MATLGLSVANDIANAILTFYVKKGALAQTIQDKPLLRILREKMEDFPAGKDNVSLPVQGSYMSDSNPLQGYSEDDQLSFNQANSLLRVAYPWKETHFGLEVSWTELKKDGITITDNNRMSEHKNAAVVRIIDSLFKNRLDDWAESWARLQNQMLWGDGSQDPKQIPGLRSILTETPSTGSTGGLDRGANVWWRHRGLFSGNNSAITASAENQTLTKTLRSEMRQLMRYGAGPTKALCGSKFIDALELEVQDKGVYTQEGFVNSGKTDAGIAKISMSSDYGASTIDRRRGKKKLEFEYDPTLDDLGLAKRAYFIDTDHIKLRPMEGEDNKLLTPERPYNYFVFFKSMTFTGALVADQLNTSAIYEVN
jgi:hypothetical protein